MNKTILLVLIGILSFSLESCSYLSDFFDARQEIEQQSSQPAKLDPPATETQEEQEEGEMLELIDETLPSQEVAGLIPATNPEVRVRGSVRGRQDPFSVVTLKPQIKIEEKEVEEKVQNNNRANRRPNRQNLPQPRPNIRPPQNIVSTPTIQEPEPFVPTLARDVVVTGLVELGGKPKIIVNAPEETSSRYVEVGQYLSNGQILVKSIDPDHFPTPLITLEQSGVEVVKAVGEEPENNG